MELESCVTQDGAEQQYLVCILASCKHRTASERNYNSAGGNSFQANRSRTHQSLIPHLEVFTEVATGPDMATFPAGICAHGCPEIDRRSAAASDATAPSKPNQRR